MNIYILHGHETAPGPPCATLVNCNNFTHVLAIVSMFIRNQGNKDKIQLGLNDTPRSQLSVCGFCIWLLQCCYYYPDKVHFSRLSWTASGHRLTWLRQKEARRTGQDAAREEPRPRPCPAHQGE